MKQQIRLVVIAVALIAATIVALMLSRNQRLGAVISNSVENSDLEAHGNRESQARANVPSYARGSWQTAPDVTKLDQLLEKSELSVGEVAYLRLQIAVMCSQATTASSARTSKPSNIRQDSFCSNFKANADTWWVDMTQLDPTDPVVHASKTASLLYELAGSNSPDYHTAVKLLDGIMLDPEGGLDSFIAAQALRQVSYVSPEVRAVARSSRWALNDTELSQAQVIAAQMRACERYQCRPGSALHLTVCSSLSGCPNNIKLEDAWRLRYGPSTYNAAKTIAEQDE